MIPDSLVRGQKSDSLNNNYLLCSKSFIPMSHSTDPVCVRWHPFNNAKNAHQDILKSGLFFFPKLNITSADNNNTLSNLEVFDLNADQKFETRPNPKQYFAALLPSLRLCRVHSRSTKHKTTCWPKTKAESHKALEHYDCKAPTVSLPSTSKMLLNTELSAQRALWSFPESWPADEL